MDWFKTLRDYWGSTFDTLAAAPPVLLFFTTLSLPILGWFILHMNRNIARNVESIFRILVYRILQGLGNLKTRVVCKIRELIPHRRIGRIDSAPQVEFDDLDLAVLRTASALGPGIAINAVELAERFRLRPAQVQRSLNKLNSNKMLDSVIGSSEGFDNYRLSQLGNAFTSRWAQQKRMPGQELASH